MAKKILVLNGSPRPGGNTEALAAALAKGAEGAGHSVTRLDIRSMKLGPCLGCYQCVAGKGSPCVQKDDMQKVYDGIADADAVVFASPLYWWHFTAQMKTVIDRIFAMPAANGMRMPKRAAALLIAAEDDREENFAQIVPYYQTCLVQSLKWEDKGMVLAGGVNMPGDVEGTPFLAEAEKLGAAL